MNKQHSMSPNEQSAMTTSMTASGPLPYKTIGRLSQYRRLLGLRLAMGQRNVYSHELAAFAGVTAAQVRRDLMIVGAKGSPTKGYDVHALIECLGGVLDDPAGQRAALVGIGNLGRALLTYFHGRRPKLSIVAAFDVDADDDIDLADLALFQQLYQGG